MPFNHVGTFLIVGFGKLLNRRLQLVKYLVLVPLIP
jgi:hypothetical protein